MFIGETSQIPPSFYTGFLRTEQYDRNLHRWLLVISLHEPGIAIRLKWLFYCDDS